MSCWSLESSPLTVIAWKIRSVFILVASWPRSSGVRIRVFIHRKMRYITSKWAPFDFTLHFPYSRSFNYFFHYQLSHIAHGTMEHTNTSIWFKQQAVTVNNGSRIGVHGGNHFFAHRLNHSTCVTLAFVPRFYPFVSVCAAFSLIKLNRKCLSRQQTRVAYTASIRSSVNISVNEI